MGGVLVFVSHGGGRVGFGELVSLRLCCGDVFCVISFLGSNHLRLSCVARPQRVAEAGCILRSLDHGAFGFSGVGLIWVLRYLHRGGVMEPSRIDWLANVLDLCVCEHLASGFLMCFLC